MTTELSANEAVLYSRQLYIFGLEGQLRLKKSCFLVDNLTSITGEFVKNIILTGVQKVVICDSKSVSEDDVTSNFWVDPSDLGRMKLDAAISRLRKLNHNVSVEVDTEDIFSKPESYFQQFDVLCSTERTMSEWAKLNEICRKNKIAFCAVNGRAFSGFIFVDFIKVKDKLYYPLGEVFAKFANGNTITRIYYAHSLYQESKTAEELFRGLKEVCQRNELNVNEDQITQFVDGRVPLVTTAAILAGILVQEIIKYFVQAGNQLPLHNTFTFNAEEMSGTIATFVPN